MNGLLDWVDSPQRLKNLELDQLQPLADQLRQCLLESVARSGGHLSANLGTVELTVALHYVLNTPEDRLIWDVGHQAYVHKMLTGRRQALSTIRQSGGLSGFPRREESSYDAFGTGHSSTSISAALGMALAAKQQGIPRKTVAVIGDGAMTAGLAYEALNHAGVSDCNLLIILNDNAMSISPPVGALNRYLAELMNGRFYAALRAMGREVAKAAPPLFGLARWMEQQAQSVSNPDTIFEKFGIHYTGPVDGHDLKTLIPQLQTALATAGPQLLHVVTQKGKGYAQAEQDPVAYHGPSKFDPNVGLVSGSAASPTTFTQVFGNWLCDMAAQDERLVAITPAMREGSGLTAFSRQFPGRYHDVGIAEQHAVTMAAGMACEGLKPVVAIYSTFLQRAYDQLIHDVALQNLPVLFALDRAGLVGADGPTHAGMFDIPFARCVPHMSVLCPADEQECRQMLTTAYLQNHPVSVRYPRGAGVGVKVERDLKPLTWATAQVRRQGKRIALLAFGPLLYEALKVGEQLNLTVVNMRWVKPLDMLTLQQVALSHEGIVTVEDGSRMGGAGTAVMEALQSLSISMPVLNLGFDDAFTAHGDPGKLMAQYGLTAPGIQTAIEDKWPGLAGHASTLVPLRKAS
jgi:1-deoxy-D-xylulose-5-phosphate synthase